MPARSVGSPGAVGFLRLEALASLREGLLPARSWSLSRFFRKDARAHCSHVGGRGRIGGRPVGAEKGAARGPSEREIILALQSRQIDHGLIHVSRNHSTKGVGQFVQASQG